MIRVKAGIFSLTAPASPDDDGSYLRWHLLDHMPEQYQLPGIVHGLRWIADGEYLDHRVVAHGQLGQVGNAVHYLVGDPVEKTFDDFVTLGRALRENGRFPVTRPSLQVAGLRLLQWQSSPHALVSAEVVPFRPHRGILLIVEEATGGRPNEWLQWLTPNTIRRCSPRQARPAHGLSVPAPGGVTYPRDGGRTTNTSPSFTSTTIRSPPPTPWPSSSKSGGGQPRCDPFLPGRCGQWSRGRRGPKLAKLSYSPRDVLAREVI